MLRQANGGSWINSDRRKTKVLPPVENDLHGGGTTNNGRLGLGHRIVTLYDTM
jgi:hypothetical protein